MNKDLLSKKIACTKQAIKMEQAKNWPNYVRNKEAELKKLEQELEAANG